MNSNLQELDEFTFHSIVVETKGISLVFFTGTDCSSCHHLRNILVTETEQFQESFDEFTAFEIRAEKATALVNEFGVFHLPSMFLYVDGVFHCELQSQALPYEIIKAIKLALSKPAMEEP